MAAADAERVQDAVNRLLEAAASKPDSDLMKAARQMQVEGGHVFVAAVMELDPQSRYMQSTERLLGAQRVVKLFARSDDLGNGWREEAVRFLEEFTDAGADREARRLQRGADQALGELRRLGFGPTPKIPELAFLTERTSTGVVPAPVPAVAPDPHGPIELAL